MTTLTDDRRAWLFLGWFDPDKKKPARQKLNEAIAQHVAKVGVRPELAIVNPATAAELGDADLPLPVETAPYVSRWTFYVGVRDDGGGR